VLLLMQVVRPIRDDHRRPDAKKEPSTHPKDLGPRPADPDPVLE